MTYFTDSNYGITGIGIYKNEVRPYLYPQITSDTKNGTLVRVSFFDDIEEVVLRKIFNIPDNEFYITEIPSTASTDLEDHTQEDWEEISNFFNLFYYSFTFYLNRG